MKKFGRFEKIVSVVLATAMLTVTGCGEDEVYVKPNYVEVTGDITAPVGYQGPKSSYMIYYGTLNAEIMEMAKHYEVVILHPRMGNITRTQVKEIVKKHGGEITVNNREIGGAHVKVRICEL